MTRLLIVLALATILLLISCKEDKPAYIQRVEQLRNSLPAKSTVVSSVSMKELKVGDILLIEARPYKDIKPGDRVYVWYTTYKIPACHIAVRPVYSSMPPHNRWLVHGDNNKTADPELMTEETYIGRWTLIKP